jgi:ribosome-binding factor A
MPSNRRSERLNQLLREELAALLQSEIKDPRLRAVTVTAVDVTQDLAYADVYVRTLTDETPSEELIAGLESAERFVRRRLGRELRLRRIPEFRFHLDRSLEHVLRIESLLEEALGDQKADEAPGDEEE